MKMERSLQPHRQTADGSASLPPVPAAAGRMLALAGISTDTCQTGTDRIKWQSDRFPQHGEAAALQRANTKQQQAGGKRTLPPGAADATATCWESPAWDQRLYRCSAGSWEKFLQGFGYLTESRGRKERKNEVMANIEEKGRRGAAGWRQ